MVSSTSVERSHTITSPPHRDLADRETDGAVHWRSLCSRVSLLETEEASSGKQKKLCSVLKAVLWLPLPTMRETPLTLNRSGCSYSVVSLSPLHAGAKMWPSIRSKLMGDVIQRARNHLGSGAPKRGNGVGRTWKKSSSRGGWRQCGKSLLFRDIPISPQSCCQSSGCAAALKCRCASLSQKHLTGLFHQRLHGWPRHWRVRSTHLHSGDSTFQTF